MQVHDRTGWWVGPRDHFDSRVLEQLQPVRRNLKVDLECSCAGFPEHFLLQSYDDERLRQHFCCVLHALYGVALFLLPS